MYLPNYKDGSIVNLMSSIGSSFGAQSGYQHLKLLHPRELRGRNVVLLLIDGMGYEFLRANKGFLWKHTRGRITSVFPPTTASAVTTIYTGVAPSQHALTGWVMYFRELGAVVKPLPGTTRIGAVAALQPCFTQDSLFRHIRAHSFNIIPAELQNSMYNHHFSSTAHILPYSSLAGLFRKMHTALRGGGRRYVYAYWPLLDIITHSYGSGSRKVVAHLRHLESAIEAFVASLKNSTLIITADHGMKDVLRGHSLNLKDHPKLAETLTLPLCGEPRLVFCYVHPDKVKQFKVYVHTHFKRVCSLVPRDAALHLFGPAPMNPLLRERIGDYLLIMKEDYCLRDELIGEKRQVHKANHGGVSKEEMYVPLIVFQK